jgi:hypothetical protein
MAPLKRPVLRFSQAVFASGLKPKSLRNWIDRGTVKLFSEREEGWQEFSHADIAMLALLAEMNATGMALPVATGIARAVIEDTGLVTGTHVDFPANALVGIFTMKLLLIWVEGEEARYALIPESEFFKKPHSARQALFVLRPAFIINNAFLSIEDEDVWTNT